MQVIIHHYRTALFMAWLVVAGSSHALDTAENSVLTIPEDFNVLYVDGRKWPQNFFSPGGAELKLAKGEHSVVMIYDQFFERGEDTDRIKSAPFKLAFVIAQETASQLQFKPPQTLEAAREFAKHPQVEVLVPAMKSVLPIQITHNIDKDMYLASYAAAVPVVSPVAPPVTPAPVAKTATLTSGEPALPQQADKIPDALQQLQYWWQQADAAQREAFLRAINVKY